MAEPRTVRENANALNSEQIAALLPHRYPFALVTVSWTTSRVSGPLAASAYPAMKNSSAVTFRASRSCREC